MSTEYGGGGIATYGRKTCFLVKLISRFAMGAPPKRSHEARGTGVEDEPRQLSMVSVCR